MRDLTHSHCGFSGRKAGFTLPELMVAASLTLFLGTTTLSVFTGVLGAWQGSSARTDAYREARAALQLVTSELQTVIPTVGEQAAIVGGVAGQGSIGFLTRLAPSLQPESKQKSDICAVSYFIAEQPRTPNASPALYRTLIPSSETFARLTASQEDLDLFPDEVTPDSPNTELVAANVSDFSIRGLNADLEEVAISQATISSGQVVFLEIRLEVLGQHHASRAFDTSLPPAVRDQALQEGRRSFVLRHRLP